ncbi:MAG: hypothetical protein R8K20_11975 [Gallionellaceae bacterium]
MFSWLLGNSNAAEKAVNGVVDGLDALVFTDEEKSIANQKVLDFKIEYAKHTQNQSISRRIITVSVCVMWLIVGLSALISTSLGATEYAKYAMKFLVDVVMQPFSIIVGFYFIAHLVGKK